MNIFQAALVHAKNPIAADGQSCDPGKQRFVPAPALLLP